MIVIDRKAAMSQRIVQLLTSLKEEPALESLRGAASLRVLVTGDRHWRLRSFLYDKLDRIHTIFPEGIAVIIHGAAHGADEHADAWAVSRGLPRIEEPALWGIHHRAAGPIRNQKMLDLHRPDLIVGFHSNIADSRGTRDMLWRAVQAKKPAILYFGSE